MKAIKPKKQQDESVRVFVRVRPLSEKERKNGNKSVVKVNQAKASVQIINPNSREAPKVYTYDATFDENNSQRDIYDQGAAIIVDGVLNGYNGTVFAYGQTGAGKSHTMQGPEKRRENPELNGIIPNSFDHIFEHITANSTPRKKFLVQVSYLEIYNEKVYDLLGKDPKMKLPVKWSPKKGAFVQGLSMHTVTSVTEIDRVQRKGEPNRSVGRTDMNEGSSRSHSIFCIVVECMTTNEKTKEPSFRKGKLNLVDLAGSERLSKTGATGARKREGININRSLVVLGNCISALTTGNSHVPYRDSVLTRLLQDSLGGNTKTVLCANCGPADYNRAESLGTLRFATRAKKIKNKPVINEDPKDALLRDLEEELQNLRKQLAMAESGQSPADVAALAQRKAQKKKEKKEKKEEKAKEKAKKRRMLQPQKIIKEVVDGMTEEEFAKRKTEQEEERKALEEQARQELEAEKRKLKMNETKQQRMARELQEEADRAEQVRKQKELLMKKMAEMQRKLVFSEKLHVETAKRAAEIRKKQLQEVKAREIEVTKARQLAEQEEKVSNLATKYSSLEEEVDKKTEKLHKIIKKYQSVKSDIKEMKEDHLRDKARLMNIRHDLDAQLKLKSLIIQYYLPPSLKKHMLDSVYWDEEANEWYSKETDKSQNFLLPKRPTHLIGLKRPTTDYAIQMASRENTSRFRIDNVVNLEMKIAKPVSKDIKDVTDSRAQTALKMALAGDTDEEIDTSIHSKRREYVPSRRTSSSRIRPKSARLKK